MYSTAKTDWPVSVISLKPLQMKISICLKALISTLSSLTSISTTLNKKSTSQDDYIYMYVFHKQTPLNLPQLGGCAIRRQSDDTYAKILTRDPKFALKMSKIPAKIINFFSPTQQAMVYTSILLIFALFYALLLSTQNFKHRRQQIGCQNI